MPVDPISLEVFKNMFIPVAEEMGVTLLRTACSPNIKERPDFSCAMFDSQGQMVAQAAHVPVHLGAMPALVAAALASKEVLDVKAGGILSIRTPGGGGWRTPDADK
jgi:N-methylhydantoinase B